MFDELTRAAVCCQSIGPFLTLALLIIVIVLMLPGAISELRYWLRSDRRKR